MDNEKLKILIVDDEPDILEILKINLENAGYKVYSASNGKKALKKADLIIPDLIILDIMMPIMDGIETCERLRLDERFKETIVIFLTARGEEYSHIAAFESGADDYITKPIRIKILISKIKAQFRRRKLLENLNRNLYFENLEILADEYKILLLGKEKLLPKKEFELLYLLANKPNKVFKRED